ncbi:MAG: helix-turn-helix domain-containing protein [Actinomycetota bacterium]|jgi:ribosome-binding protein aMBF1 (putative translation factor)|nr:helix-turn-helix domain-containing protein [Actinomycetota bacterium]
MTRNTTWEELRAQRSADDPEAHEAYEQARIDFELAQLAYDLRKRAGLTQKELAARMGTTQSAIARLEGGGTTPTIELLKRLGEATGTKLVLAVGEDVGTDAMQVRFAS